MLKGDLRPKIPPIDDDSKMLKIALIRATGQVYAFQDIALSRGKIGTGEALDLAPNALELASNSIGRAAT